MDEYVGIVKELAEFEVWHNEYEMCVFCGVEPTDHYWSEDNHRIPVLEHKPDCLWLRARILLSLTPSP